MKFNRCPICHCCIDIFALAKDEATSQLLTKLATMDSQFGYALLNYLSLFSPAKSGLTADRSLRLIAEIEQMAEGEIARMALAMTTTAQIQYEKRQNGEEVQSFSNHNYLKKVFAGAALSRQLKASAPIVEQTAPPLVSSRPRSATGEAWATLEAMKKEP